MGKSLLRIMILCTPFMLVACGEGWEVQRIDNVVPYGGSRTAGTGVAYVRAKMMPEKALKVEPLVVAEPGVVVEADPVLDAEEIFSEAQVKGGAPHKKQIKKKQDVKKDEVSADPVISEKHSLNTQTGDVLAEVEKTEKTVAFAIQEKVHGASGLSAEEYIKHAPKKLVSVQVEAVEVANVMPAIAPDTIEIYENVVAQPAEEIISPKKDIFEFKSQGQYDLDDIYDDPFTD